MSDTHVAQNPFQHSGVTSASAIILGRVDLKVAAAFYDRITILDVDMLDQSLSDFLGSDLDFLCENKIIDVQSFDQSQFPEGDPGHKFACAIGSHISASVFSTSSDKKRIGEVAGNGMARLHVAMASKLQPMAALSPIITARLAAKDFGKEVHLDRVPVLDDDELEDLLPVRATATRVIFEQLPVPSRSTPWQDILEFRAEADTGLHAARLRLLLKKLSQETDRSHASDLIRSDFADFEGRLRGMKQSRRLARTQMVLPWLDTIHNLFKAIALAKPSEAALPFITMQKQQIEMNEAERKLKSDPFYMIEHVRSRLAW